MFTGMEVETESGLPPPLSWPYVVSDASYFPGGIGSAMLQTVADCVVVQPGDDGVTFATSGKPAGAGWPASAEAPIAMLSVAAEIYAGERRCALLEPAARGMLIVSVAEVRPPLVAEPGSTGLEPPEHAERAALRNSGSQRFIVRPVRARPGKLQVAVR
jgi:hypothetical protein